MDQYRPEMRKSCLNKKGAVQLAQIQGSCTNGEGSLGLHFLRSTICLGSGIDVICNNPEAAN
jgi:hypothetical protein